jgi:hypothetical protein
VTVTVTKDKTAELLKAVAALTKTRVLAGIPADGADRTPEPGEKSAPNNALLGYLAEYGQPENNTPARPHLLPGIESVMPQVIERMKAAGVAALSGKKMAVQAQFVAVGLLAQNGIRAYITDATFAPLAPRTIKQRESRGRSGTKPLMDTGQLRRAYTYVIEQKK